MRRSTTASSLGVVAGRLTRQSTSGADGQVGVEPPQARRGDRPRVVRGPIRAARRRHRAGQHGRSTRSSSVYAGERRRGRGPATRKPVRPWSTSVSSPPTAGGHDRHAARRRLEGDEPEALRPRRHERRRRRRGSRSTGCGAAGAARSAPGRRGRARRSRARSFSTSASPSAPLARPRPRSTASGRSSAAERPHRDVDALERLDAADEQQHRVVAETEGLAGAAAGRRARRRRARRRGRRSRCARAGRRTAGVNCVGLLRAAHADGVGAADDLRLGPLPPSGSRSPPSAFTRASVWNVLTSGRSELVLHPVAGHARQPVVGVDDVAPARASRWSITPSANASTVAGELLLGEVERPGVDVDDPEARLDGHLVGQVVAPARARRWCSRTPAWASADTSSRT